VTLSRTPSCGRASGTQAISAGRLESRYFGIAYRIPAGWVEQVKGPPPSDSGNYVLALLVPSDAMSKSVRGSILVQAQDLFFTAAPAANALQMVSYVRDHLPPGQQVVRAPSEVKLGDRTFARLDYAAPDIGRTGTSRPPTSAATPYSSSSAAPTRRCWTG
jgi:hypothetical protein